MTRIGIIVIGDEILLGRVTDTNSGAISRTMDRFGCKTVSVCTIGDSKAAITDAVRTVMSQADIIFTTGGLGPTKDDITKQAMLDIFGGTLVHDREVTENIERIFASRNLTINPLTADQALVPSTARIIQNKLGTAPIMVFEREGKFLVSMPGVPSETEGMLPEVAPYVLSLFNPEASEIHHATRIVTGMTESALAAALDDFENRLPDNFKLAYLPDSPIIRLRLDAIGDVRKFNRHLARLDARLAELNELFILGEGEKSVQQIVIERLREAELRLSTAESCTGGNIARLLTSIAGASDVFNGGVVSYANSVKKDVLKVSENDLEEYGAVSRQVVEQMAAGVATLTGTECSVSTSGIAGPRGGTDEKPVGTVWIAVKTPNGTHSCKYRFSGNRERVINSASITALVLLLKELEKAKSVEPLCPLLGMNLDDLKAVCSEIDARPFAAKQIARWLYVARVTSIDQMTDLSKEVRNRLSQKYCVGREEPLSVVRSKDGTVKYLFNGTAGRDIEAVYIPDHERATLCVSSQAGCRMGCRFCMTGRFGLQGNITPTQIINQVLSVEDSEKLTNLVFMGMGEPTDNVDAVLKVIEILTATWGLAWSPKRITVSSIGKLPELERILNETKVHIAISIHHPFSQDRARLMPVEKAWNTPQILSLLSRYDWKGQRRLSFEYILWKDDNDSMRHADALARIIAPLGARVNLIRFHDIGDTSLRPCSKQTMEAFRDRLNLHGVTATIRASRGEDILAACGMLAGNKKEC